MPAEPLAAAADTLVRAALGRPRRDLATTRYGAIQYLLARVAPLAAVDRVVTATVRTRARQGLFDRSELVKEFVARMRA